jgi:hypothetical protein
MAPMDLQLGAARFRRWQVFYIIMAFVIWSVMGFVVACVAHEKGFWVAGWCVYGILLWPIALVHALVAKPHGEVAGTLRSHDKRDALTGSAS